MKGFSQASATEAAVTPTMPRRPSVLSSPGNILDIGQLPDQMIRQEDQRKLAELNTQFSEVSFSQCEEGKAEDIDVAAGSEEDQIPSTRSSSVSSSSWSETDCSPRAKDSTHPPPLKTL